MNKDLRKFCLFLLWNIALLSETRTKVDHENGSQGFEILSFLENFIEPALNAFEREGERNLPFLKNYLLNLKFKHYQLGALITMKNKLDKHFFNLV